MNTDPRKQKGRRMFCGALFDRTRPRVDVRL
jgi:hypothetical protein